LNQLKHLAAFQNPEFYKKQKMRFSTHATPRVICCAEMSEGYLSLPRGCLKDMETLLKEYEVALELQDKRFPGTRLECSFRGTLSNDQEKALEDVLSCDFGVFVAPPGSGKTVLALAAIAQRKTNALILVHRKPLMDQWRLQIASLLGIDKSDIGQIGGGKDKSTGLVDVAMVQSLDDEGSVDDRIAEYGFVIVDECHHVSAFSFERVLTQARAKYVLGLTATPYRRDGHQPIIHMQCGPICHQIKQGDFSPQLTRSAVYIRETDFSYEWHDDSKIYDVWSKLIADEERNQLIINDIVKALDEGRFPLILTERREHLERLSESLKDKVDFMAVLYGGLKKRVAHEVFERLKEDSADGRKTILATGSYIGEGFDEPRLDTLFLTMPSSFRGKIVQYAGRLHRYHKEKRDVRIYDYVDSKVSVLDKMFQRRSRTYKMLGYSVDHK
jgi:superfamily II DNA or RNA helicase